jgi:diguanylate cyclase (GGDEF)-like protein
MDINMPGMDGYETCRRLKANRHTQQIPIIFLSAMSEVDDKVRGFEAGGVDYITKPFQVDEVLARLETHLSIRRLQKQLEAANAELARRLADLSQVQEAERQQRIFAETLTETFAAVNSSLDYNKVLDLIMENMARVVSHDSANIALIEGKNGKIIRVRGYEDRGGGVYVNQKIPVDSQSTWKKVTQCKLPVVVNDTLKDPDWVQIPTLIWIRSHVCVPILSKNYIMGFLNMDSAVPNFFTQEHARRMKTFADQAAVAIEKADLYRQATRLATIDGLTKVHNRRHLLELAKHEFERTRRYHHPLSALMIDLDHFKHVNDTYGHPIGDQALIALANCCKQNLRPSDLFGRYGGEEFLVLLPETPHDQAMEVAERLRSQIEQITLRTEKGPVRFTASVGIATMTEQDNIDLDHLIIQADDALYEAKGAGRNRVHG